VPLSGVISVSELLVFVLELMICTFDSMISPEEPLIWMRGVEDQYVRTRNLNVRTPDLRDRRRDLNAQYRRSG
jgi:hypothetical protein